MLLIFPQTTGGRKSREPGFRDILLPVWKKWMQLAEPDWEAPMVLFPGLSQTSHCERLMT